MTKENEIGRSGLTQALLDFATGLEFEDIPPREVDYCKLLIMDTLGVALPGRQAPGCLEVAELVRQWGGAPLSTLLFHEVKLSPPLAAMANSMMMHALDFDDTLDASALHCMVSVLPAALAAAEDNAPVHGRRFITACVLGVEVICRLSLGITRPLSWIRTATCGSFGAAVAAGKVLGLDKEGLWNALGIVYAQTAGNAQGLIEGRLIKRMQPGFAARAGVEAAYLARAGISGSRDFLEGPYGFYNLYERGAYDPGPVRKGLGEDFLISQLSIKPYPCCRMTHASIDAALKLRPGLAGEFHRIDKIEIQAAGMVTEMVGKPFVVGDNPQVDAQFSIPYTVSAALLRGDVFLGDFELGAILDGETGDLASRVIVTADSSLPEKDIMHAAMSIRLISGDCLETKVSAPLGNPARPMDLRLCREKFNKCLAYSGLGLDLSRMEAFLAFMENLDQAPDAGRLAQLVSG